MEIMPYGSLRLAEKNSAPGSKLKISEWQWEMMTRSLNRYEYEVARYFNKEVNEGLWLGESYIMYGGQGPLEVSSGYVGIRYHGNSHEWYVATLSDRSEETSSVYQVSTFDLAWKEVIYKLIWYHFFLSEIWDNVHRGSFFDGWNISRSHLFKIDGSGEFVEGFTDGAEDAYGSLLSYRRIRGWGQTFPSFVNEGYIFFDKYEKNTWFRSPVCHKADLSWSFGVDVEEWVQLLFRVGFSKN